MPKEKKKALRKIKDALVHQLNDLKKEREEAEKDSLPQWPKLAYACAKLHEAIEAVKEATIMDGKGRKK